MSRRVLVAPAPLREIEHTYGPILRGAGYTIEYPPRDNFLTEQQMSEEELLAQLPGCLATLAGSEPYTRAVIAKAAAAGLKVIARAGVGYDAVDLQAATDHGVAVCFAPGTNQDAVAEHAFMLMLALTRKLREQDTEIRRGDWPRRAVGNLRGKTLGVVGLGRIGKAVAKRAIPFDLKVIATEIAPDHAFAAAHNVTFVPLEELLKQADIITLHVPKTPLTKNLINRDTLAQMKPTAFVLNTSRGGVVHEKDLYDALVANRIAGAGLDVYESEPPGNNPLFTLDNIILTAHTAGVDQQSRQDMARLPAHAIVKLLAGEWPADWVVNPQVKEKFFARAVQPRPEGERAPMSEDAIEIERLVVRYRGKPALDGLNLRVPRGAVYAFLGDNGAGKTTTMKILTGLAPPDTGRATILGLDCWSRATELRHRVGYMPERPRFYDWMSVGDIGWFTAAFHKPGFLDRYREWADRFGLDFVKRLKDLSKGGYARVGLALALAPDPEVLLLDEPTSGLDLLTRREFLASLSELAASGRTVFITSHSIAELERTCTHVGLLRDGKMILSAPIEEVRKKVRRLSLRFTDAPPDPTGLGTILEKYGTGRFWQVLVQDPNPDAIAALRQRTDVSDFEDLAVSLEEVYAGLMAKSAENGTVQMVRKVEGS